MLDKREGLFSDEGYVSFEIVKLVVAAAQKLLLFFFSDNFDESPKALYHIEGAYQLLYRADVDQKCQLVPFVDDVLNNPPSSMGVPVGQLTKVLQRCGDRAFSRKTKPFLCA